METLTFSLAVSVMILLQQSPLRFRPVLLLEPSKPVADLIADVREPPLIGHCLFCPNTQERRQLAHFDLKSDLSERSLAWHNPSNE